MSIGSDKVACRTPTPGKSGATNIPKWKFDLLRDAILSVLKQGDLPFSELASAVGKQLSEEQIKRLGSLKWHVTSVKLELEVRGELVRITGSSPQIVSLGNLASG